ncbi:Ribonuclease VapC40 [Paraconexibacter sp. AEG42_29]|uniref:Ribonuclease VapC n=1 Tax=Paraconexibacter sp. AEG42_29 TaxID=2997339 RepID=A0AAU7B202_9ACTN
MIAPDTSVVIAALSPWHEGHGRARAALLETSDRALVGHVALETTSALSRMPAAHRVAPAVTLEALTLAFPDDWLVLDAEALRATLGTLVRAGVRGGALCDGVIGLTALHHGATLVSADRRAASTYDALGVPAVFV